VISDLNFKKKIFTQSFFLCCMHNKLAAVAYLCEPTPPPY
jgi:hypothetical protein